MGVFKSTQKDIADYITNATKHKASYHDSLGHFKGQCNIYQINKINKIIIKWRVYVPESVVTKQIVHAAKSHDC